jgi:hypothetical protein
MFKNKTKRIESPEINTSERSSSTQESFQKLKVLQFSNHSQNDLILSKEMISSLVVEKEELKKRNDALNHKLFIKII